MSPRCRTRSVSRFEGWSWGALTLLIAMIVMAAGASASRAARAAAEETAAGGPTVVSPSKRPHRVIAYYFHTTRRCASCRAIEAYSREAIETAFARELKDSRLIWRPVNIEIKGNEHFVKDYQLYTKSLILVNEVRGRAPQWKNLEKVWQLLSDKEKFLQYVRDETRAYLAPPTS